MRTREKSGSGDVCVPRPIGIPRALFYYLHPRLWEVFFREMGIPVVVSDPNNRGMVERAGLISESEHCLPVKLLDAHLDFLLDKVDRVFVPRILSLRRGHIACPKLAALPDAMEAQFGDRVEVVTVDVNEGRFPLKEALVRLGRRLDVSRKDAIRAADKACRTMEEAMREASAPSSGNGAGKGFLLIGHPYNLFDAYMAGPVCRKLESLEVAFERIAFDKEIEDSGPLHWDTCGVIYDTLRNINPERWAGVIQLASFSCGCDSISSTIFRGLARNKRIPYMVLTLDEHTACAGIDTRLEAFVDSIGGSI